MKIPTRLAPLVLAAAMASCGPKEAPAPGSAAAPLRVGVEAKYEPFESTNAKGEFEGFDIDLAREIGKSLGRPVEFKDMAFDALIPEMQAGRIDMICSGMSYTQERTLLVDFTKPYAQSPMSVLVSTERAGDVTKTAQLNDASIHIAVQRGTTGETKAKAAFPKATFKDFGGEAEAATEVGTGRAHAFVYDYLSVLKYSKRYPQTTRVLDESLGGEDYCIAVAKGSPLKAKIDSFLDDAKKDGGALGRLMDKWLPGAAEKLKPK
jgi:polar amino acid transport system substrate-binding protein